MAEKLRGIPFDANEIILPDGSPGYDNVLYAADFAEWMKTYFKNGVLVAGGALISTEMQVTKTDDTHIKIDVGNMVVNGRTTFIPEPMYLEIDKAGPNVKRYDRIVVELNLASAINSFRLIVLKGIMEENPSIPVITRDGDIYQMSIATVKVNQAGIYEIVDERTDDNLCGISQVLIGVKPPLPVTGDDASNIGYDPSASGLIGTTVQSAIDEVVTIVNNKGNVHSLTFMNVSVPSSLWQATSSYESAKYSATISLAGVTEDMIADVIFAPDEADSGAFSGGCITGTDWITLLAKYKPSNDIVIPTIIASKVVN